MKELTESVAINDAIYEMNLNGSYPIVKLSVGTVDDKEKDGMVFESEIYHFTFPGKNETKLYDQPLTEGGEAPVYSGGGLVEKPECCCHSLGKGESKIVTSRKVVAHGPIWVWTAIAVGLAKEGSERPYIVAEAADTYGDDATTESEMIGFIKGKQRELTARLVRRAHLGKLPLAAIRTAYKYVFVEPEQIGRAKVKQL